MLNKVKARLDDTVIVVVTNSDKFSTIQMTAKAGQSVQAEDNILELKTEPEKETIADNLQPAN